MTNGEHLWAVAYDDIGRANQVRDEIVRLGWDEKYLVLNDVAVVVRHVDGSFTLDRERFPSATNILGSSAVGFIAGLVLGVPMIGATIGAMVGGAGTVMTVASTGITGEFVTEVQGLMKPGTSAVFVLDAGGDMEVILHAIRGLGGTVLKDQRGCGAGPADPIHSRGGFQWPRRLISWPSTVSPSSSPGPLPCRPECLRRPCRCWLEPALYPAPVTWISRSPFLRR